MHCARQADNNTSYMVSDMQNGCTNSTSFTNLHTMQSNSHLYKLSHEASTRLFSTIAAAATPNPNTESSNSDSSNDGKKDKKKEDNSNLFLDNLGKIFLSSLGLILLLLLRSTTSNNSKSALQEDIESNAVLDPLEIDDLRCANADFTIDVWESIVIELKKEFGGREKVTYPEFLSVVTRVMRNMRGEGFTIQFGHLVDRVVIAELERMGVSDDVNTSISSDGDVVGEGEGEEVRLLQKEEIPLFFLLTALSLALNSTVSNRVRVLYDSMLLMNDAQVDQTTTATTTATLVPGERVCQMIQNLQNTCQLVPGAQIVETNSKIPYQTYRVGTGVELTRRAREGYGGKKGNAGVTKEGQGPVTLEEFHAILKSRTVCAWGECYVKKTGRTSTSDR